MIQAEQQVNIDKSDRISKCVTAFRHLNLAKGEEEFFWPWGGIPGLRAMKHLYNGDLLLPLRSGGQAKGWRARIGAQRSNS